MNIGLSVWMDSRRPCKWQEMPSLQSAPTGSLQPSVGGELTMRPTKGNRTGQRSWPLSNPVPVIPRLDDPLSVRRATRHHADVVRPDNDCPDCWAMRLASKPSPPAGLIASPVGHTEPLSKLPAAPCMRSRIMAGDMVPVMMPVSRPGMCSRRDKAGADQRRDKRVSKHYSSRCDEHSAR